MTDLYESMARISRQRDRSSTRLGSSHRRHCDLNVTVAVLQRLEALIDRHAARIDYFQYPSQLLRPLVIVIKLAHRPLTL